MDKRKIFKSYGQKEPLTHRLRTLLRDYSDGLAVLKELIQNADDAGATEIQFIYDERENFGAGTSLFDRGMAELQGPALWAFNDAQFTPEDFNNIVKLSGATKELERAKVGRFGLGFNSVYNLTDVPSFISGSRFVVFDPHMTHLGTALEDRSNPGIQVDIEENPEVLSYFADQFAPFHGICGCDLRSVSSLLTFQGTLFRFPLRTENQAKVSEISHKHYNQKEVMLLFDLFEQIKDSILLFTQNISEISVQHIKSTDTTPPVPNLWLHIQKSTIREIRRTYDKQANFLKKTEQKMKKRGVAEADTKLCLVETLSTGKGNQSPKKLNFIWYVGQCMGTKDSLDFAKSTRGEKLLPVAGLAAQMKRIGTHYTPVKMQASLLFCFLPLPIGTKLPVHINGYFALTQDRRSLISKDIHDKQQSGLEWNVALFRDAITNAYINFIEDLHETSKEEAPRVIFDVWPSPTDQRAMEHFLNEFLSAFSSAVCSDKLNKIFPHPTGWKTYKDIVALDEPFLLHYEAQNAKEATEKIYLANQERRRVIDLPMTVLQILKHMVPAKLISRERFYNEIFLPNMQVLSKEQQDLLVLSDLHNGEKSLIKDYKCIPVDVHGCHHSYLGDLIDPESTAACLYETDEKRFPTFSKPSLSKAGYSKNMLLTLLRTLGMKDGSEWNEILGRCQKVKDIPRDRQKQYLETLMKIIEQNLFTTFPNPEMQKRICEVDFLPVINVPPNDVIFEHGLRWKGKEYAPSVLLKPADLFAFEDQHIACCIKPIVPEGLVQARTKELLGLSRGNNTMQLALEQLQEIAKIQSKCTISPYLWSIFDAVYKVFEMSQLPEHIVHYLQQIPCIPHNNGILKPSQCARDFNGGDQCAPYIFKVNTLLYQAHEGLLRRLGVKEMFDTTDFVRVLSDIKQIHNNRKLDDTSLKTTLSIIGHLADSMEQLCEEERKNIGHLFIPDRNGIMKEASTLCYEASVDSWIHLENETLCHSKISPHNANIMGVKTLREEKLCGKHIALPFGQHERLCNRLRRLLTGYGTGNELIKELVQNADDAGATEIHFVLDHTTHRKSKIFDSTWECLQGPALCVYNDRQFTHADIQGIQNLGEGSKYGNLDKIGQYGVGFNCVYQVTDTPTFLTTVDGEKVLCVFDPNIYLARSTKQDPGTKYIDVENLKKTFTDVFTPYMENIFGGQGTVFRFPLRTRQQAHQSQISENAVSPEDVEKLFKNLIEGIDELLLFVKTLQTIHFSIRKEGKLKHFAKVTCRLEQSEKEKKQAFFDKVNDIILYLKGQHLQLQNVGVTETSYMLTTCNDQRSHTWVVNQRIGTESHDIPETVVHEYNIRKTPFLPLGGTAYHLCCSTTGKLFCFLPLPVRTSLPIHINGSFILDSENRKRIRYDRTGNFETQWNIFVLEKVVAPTYVSLMKFIKEYLYRRSPAQYHKLFPDIPFDKPFVKQMVEAFYKHVAQNAEQLLPVEELNGMVSWHEPISDYAQCYFDTITDNLLLIPESQKEKRSSMKKLISILRNAGMKILSAPMRISKHFQACDVAVKNLEPDPVLEHLKHNTPLVGPIPTHLSNTVFENVHDFLLVLQYCSQSESFQKNLSAAPLLLTSDEQLHMCSTTRKAFLCHEKEMHKLGPGDFVHPECSSYFKVSNESGDNVVKNLDICDISDLVRQNSPTLVCEFHNNFLPKLLFPKDKQPIEKWLPALWQYIGGLIKQAMTRQKKTKLSKTDCIVRFLEPLGNLYLLPVFTTDTECLLAPVKTVHQVVDLTVGDRLSEKLRSVLKKCNVLQPDHKLIRSALNVPNILEELFATVDKPGQILLSVSKAFQGNTILLHKMDSSYLVQYFSNTIQIIVKTVPGYQEILCKLPIYESIGGEIIDLYRKDVVVIPIQIPSNGLADILRKYDVAFLNDISKSLSSFSTFCECFHSTQMEFTEFYLKFIFPAFNRFGRQDMLVHLEFLCSKLTALMAYKEMKLALNNLPFVPRGSQLLRAELFFSRNNDLFVKMCDPSEFLPEPFDNPEWAAFMQFCGVQCNITKTTFHEFATKLHKASLLQNTEASLHRLKSRLLVKSLFTQSELQDLTFYEEIREIPFIAPEELCDSLERIHPFPKQAPDSREKYLHYHGTHLASSSHLVWTTQSEFIPRWADPSTYANLPFEQDQVDAALGLIRRPRGSSICLNLVNVCLHAHLPDKHLEGVLMEMYSELQRLIGTNDEDVECLKEIPCLLVDDGKSLVQPSIVVIDLEVKKQMKPYLYKYPTQLGAYVSFFQSIGVRENTTVLTFARILESMYHDQEDMDTDDDTDSKRQTIPRAFTAFLKSLESEKAFPQISVLYLPTTEIKLVPSHEAVYIDRPSLKERITNLHFPMLLSLAEAGCDIAPHQMDSILKLMPLNIRPKLLSDIVMEKLAFEPELYREDGLLALSLRKKLQSEIFLINFVRLANKCAAEKLQEAPAADAMKAKIGTILVVGMKQLQTIVTKDGKKISDPRPAFAFLELCMDGTFLLYVTNEADYDTDIKKEVLHQVTREITNMFPTCLIDILCLRDMLECTLEDVPRCMEAHHVSAQYYDRSDRARVALIEQRTRERCPDINRARRWVLQAEYDLQSIPNDMAPGSESYEWACHKAHQTAEKALKAAGFAYGLDQIMSHFLTDLTTPIKGLSSHLQTAVGQLNKIVRDVQKTKYPDRVNAPDVPHTVYDVDDSTRAIQAAKLIVEEVKSFIDKSS